MFQWFKSLFQDNEEAFQQQLTIDLKALGNTVDQVRAALNFYGIKGNHKMPTSCPIANYLKWKHPNQYLTVGKDYVRRFVNDEDSYIQHPSAVEAFIKKFDEGGFPELEVRNV